MPPDRLTDKQALALLETYHDSLPVIASTCRWAARQYKTRYDDLVADCSSYVLTAWRQYDPTRGVPWRPYLGGFLSNRLADRFRQEQVRRRLLPPADDQATALTAVVDVNKPFDLDAFCDPLSSDAKTALRLVFYPETCPVKGPTQPVKQRVTLRRKLRGMGWTRLRVVKTFNEIRRAL